MTDVPPSETTRWRAVVRVLRSPLDSLSCAILPASCVLCGSPLPQLSPAPICNVCWTEFPVQSGHACARCGDALTRRRANRFAAVQGLPAGAAAVCAGRGLRPLPGPHEGGDSRAQVRPAAPGRARAGQDAGRGDCQLAGQAPAEMLVVPVPLHRSKYAQRGFNQARSLARDALRLLRKSHPEWRLTLAASTLMRLRATESQAGLTPRQRRMNVRGAFSVSDPAKVTMQACFADRRHFHHGRNGARRGAGADRAGAASVWVATLARAQRMQGWRSRFRLRQRGGKRIACRCGAAERRSNGEGLSSDSSLQGQPSF